MYTYERQLRMYPGINKCNTGIYTVCPTRYRSHFFNNSNTNEDIATKFEQGTFVVWEMKRNVSVVCACSAPNCCDTEQQYPH
jgi:hypothetical protein